MKSEDKRIRRMGPILEETYRFILWLTPTVEKFPRSRLSLLGDRMQTRAVDVLEGLIAATWSKPKTEMLRRVNLDLETLRFYFRLAKDLHYIDLRRYEFAARNLDSIGRQVGGWLKSSYAKETSQAV